MAAGGGSSHSRLSSMVRRVLEARSTVKLGFDGPDHVADVLEPFDLAGREGEPDDRLDLGDQTQVAEAVPPLDIGGRGLLGDVQVVQVEDVDHHVLDLRKNLGSRRSPPLQDPNRSARLAYGRTAQSRPRAPPGLP